VQEQINADMINVAIIPGALLITVGSGLMCGPCFAQPASVPEGYRLAQQVCVPATSLCRMGTPPGLMPPSFANIANRSGITQQRLADFIQKPHMHMLMDHCTRGQANDIAAYVLSQRHK